MRINRFAVQIQINDDAIGVYESSPGSTFDSTFNSFGIEATAVESVTFESVGIDDGEWVSLLEVGHTPTICGTKTSPARFHALFSPFMTPPTFLVANYLELD